MLRKILFIKSQALNPEKEVLKCAFLDARAIGLNKLEETLQLRSWGRWER